MLVILSHNGRFDMREVAYLEELLKVYDISDLTINLIKGADSILNLSEGRTYSLNVTK